MLQALTWDPKPPKPKPPTITFRNDEEKKFWMDVFITRESKVAVSIADAALLDFRKRLPLTDVEMDAKIIEQEKIIQDNNQKIEEQAAEMSNCQITHSQNISRNKMVSENIKRKLNDETAILKKRAAILRQKIARLESKAEGGVMQESKDYRSPPGMKVEMEPKEKSEVSAYEAGPKRHFTGTIV